MISRNVLDAAIAGLNDSQVFDLARNAAAPIETRLFATEKLFDKASHFASKAEISGLIEQVKHGRLAVEVSHESETDAPQEEAQSEVPEDPTPVLRASFTTHSVQ